MPKRTSACAKSRRDNQKPTARIRNEDPRQISQLTELILEQTADAVIYSNRQGIIERWNKAATVLFGYEWIEANGQSLNLIIPESLRAAHWRGFEAAVMQGATRLHGRPTLTRAEHKSGARLYVEMSFSLVTDELGNVLGSVAMARDATDRVQRQKATAKAGEQAG